MTKHNLYKTLARTAFWLAQNTYCGDDSLPIANSKTHFVSGGFPILLLSGKTFQYITPNNDELEIVPITILQNYKPIALVEFNTDEYGGIDECLNVKTL